MSQINLEKAEDVAQEVWLTCKKPQVQSPGPHKPEMAVHTCNLALGICRQQDQMSKVSWATQ